jgi:hypothetical protein
MQIFRTRDWIESARVMLRCRFYQSYQSSLVILILLLSYSEKFYHADDKQTRTLKWKGIFRKSLLYFFKLRDTGINLFIIKLTAIEFWSSETSYLIFRKNHECSAYFWDLTKFDEIAYFGVRVFLSLASLHNNQSQFCHSNHINNSKCCRKI